MPLHRRVLSCLALILGCCALPESTYAQGNGATLARVITPPHANSLNLFTVMGHVRDQRAFELATASPTLVELISVFGQGLTETASNNVRIIRNGRVIKVFYKKNSTERLMPGDLVIVDGRSSHGTIIRGGRSNSATADGVVRVGVLGILPYPLILEFSAGHATTLSSVAGSLGQSESEVAMSRVRVIAPRRSGRTDPASPIADCSVIVFDPSTIDVSRLPRFPERLKPVRPGQSAPPVGRQDATNAQVAPPPGLETPRPLAQVPFARSLTVPGIATVPSGPTAGAGTPQAPQTMPRGSAAAPSQDDQPLQRDAEERVRDLLTSPSSVAIESAQRPDRTTDPSGPGRVSLDAQTGEDAATRKSSGNNSSGRTPSLATKPFQSFVEQPAERDDGTVELPLTPADSLPVDGAASSGERPDGELPVAVEKTQQPAALANDDISRSRSSADSSMPFPTPVESSSQLATAAGTLKSNAAALRPVETKRTESRVLDAVQQGRVEPKPVSPANWPLVSALAIGGTAALSVLVMMIIVAWRKPEAPMPIVPGERFWLDRMIQNELPIEDEPVDLPNGEQLFGKATPIHRVDAAHSSVPKPHFLAAGGESGVRRSGAPPLDDPESDESDSPTTDTGEIPGTRTPRRDDRPNRSQPQVPLRPAAEHSVPVSMGSRSSTGFALDLTRTPASSVANEATETSRTPRRRAFRVDSGHQPAPRPGVRTGAVEKPVTVEQVSTENGPGNSTTTAQREVARQANGARASIDSETSSGSKAADSAVRRPRFLKKQSVVLAETQSVKKSLPAVSVQPVADSRPVVDEPQAAVKHSENSESSKTGAEKPQPEISVKPARSVAQNDDLLDRVLSSVNLERRGDQ